MFPVENELRLAVGLGVHGQGDLAAHRRGESREKAIVVGLRNGVELVIVAAGEPMVRPSIDVPTVARMSSNSS